MKKEETKLPKKFKTQFVKALRSGEYKQGEGYLKEGNKKDGFTYCCLGVAAELIGCLLIPSKHSYIMGRDDFQMNAGNKPVKGYTKVPKILQGKGSISDKLAGMNDSGISFEDIATYIEENL